MFCTKGILTSVSSCKHLKPEVPPMELGSGEKSINFAFQQLNEMDTREGKDSIALGVSRADNCLL